MQHTAFSDSILSDLQMDWCHSTATCTVATKVDSSGTIMAAFSTVVQGLLLLVFRAVSASKPSIPVWTPHPNSAHKPNRLEQVDHSIFMSERDVGIRPPLPKPLEAAVGQWQSLVNPLGLCGSGSDQQCAQSLPGCDDKCKSDPSAQFATGMQLAGIKCHTNSLGQCVASASCWLEMDNNDANITASAASCWRHQVSSCRLHATQPLQDVDTVLQRQDYQIFAVWGELRKLMIMPSFLLD